MWLDATPELRQLPLRRLKTAFSRFPSVHRAVHEGQQRVETGPTDWVLTLSGAAALSLSAQLAPLRGADRRSRRRALEARGAAWPDRQVAPPAKPQMAPQMFENIESTPGNDRTTDAPNLQDLVSWLGRASRPNRRGASA
jgi:hypothetical protein